jgi:hypothetical protein
VTRYAIKLRPRGSRLWRYYGPMGRLSCAKRRDAYCFPDEDSARRVAATIHGIETRVVCWEEP